MADTTLPLLTAGGAIATGDLFLTRQGADTSDTKVTGTQMRTFVLAASNTITSLGTITSGTVDGGTA